MAERQSSKTSSRRTSKGGGHQAAERATQTWRQPPKTPRAKMVRKETRTVRVPRSRGAGRGWGTWLRRVNWLQVAVFVGLASVMGVLIWGIMQEPFRISGSSIEVIGNHRLEAWEVVRAADIEGANAFTILPSDVAKRVAGLEGVNEVTVRVRLPNRLIVELKEFLPLVAWQTPEGTRWLSEDGALIPISGDPPGLTLIDPMGEAADENGNLRPSLLAGLAVVAQMRPELREIYYGKLEGLYFRSPEGWTVYLGEEGRMARKLAILEGMKQTISTGNTPAQVLDLRFEGFTTFK